MQSAYEFDAVDPQSFGEVAVLMGGRSGEREVSLQSGAAVLKALRSAGVSAFGLDLYGAQGDQNPIVQLQQQPFDLALNMLHGGEGENGVICALLELLGIPYSGSGVAASSLAMNKLLCKQIWRGMGLPSADFMELKADADWHRVVERLGLPLMVKPATGGSSIGMTKVECVDQLAAAYALAAQEGDSGSADLVIAEPWLTGKEYTVAILQGAALPVICLATKRQFYDYQAKYVDDDTSYLIPSGLSDAEEQQVKDLALAAFNSIGCSGWGRADLMRDAKGDFQLLEVNTVPGMTSHSLVPKAAQAAGLNFQQLVLHILSSAKRN